MGTGLVASIFYLQGSTTNYFKSWGGTASVKVQTTDVINHFKGVKPNTGSPTASTSPSNLMNQLSNYEGNIAIPTPKPTTLTSKPTAIATKPLVNATVATIEKPLGAKELANKQVTPTSDKVVTPNAPKK
jgi:hypothetical protein